MKTTLFSLLSLAITATTAVALPQPVAELDARWCALAGRGCWKTKRTAAAQPEPEPAEDAAALEARWCRIAGRGCWKVKRAADAFSAFVASSSGPAPQDADSAASNAPGGAAFHAKRAVDRLAGLVASTQDAPQEYYDGLNLGDHFEPDTEPTTDKGGSYKTKRSTNDKRWCRIAGRGCWKAKRAAETLVETIDGFEPEDPARVERRWCALAGRGCWKRDVEEVDEVERRCNAPGGACAKARRDLTAMYHAARSVLEELEKE